MNILNLTNCISSFQLSYLIALLKYGGLTDKMLHHRTHDLKASSFEALEQRTNDLIFILEYRD